MQGRENSGESRTHLEMLRAMYPGHCGYKSETGGIMKNLRESTSHQKVVNYHKEFYRPENLGQSWTWDLMNGVIDFQAGTYPQLSLLIESIQNVLKNPVNSSDLGVVITGQVDVQEVLDTVKPGDSRPVDSKF